jgi:hypothetical protein
MVTNRDIARLPSNKLFLLEDNISMGENICSRTKSEIGLFPTWLKPENKEQVIIFFNALFGLTLTQQQQIELAKLSKYSESQGFGELPLEKNKLVLPFAVVLDDELVTIDGTIWGSVELTNRTRRLGDAIPKTQFIGNSSGGGFLSVAPFKNFTNNPEKKVSGLISILEKAVLNYQTP